MDEPSEFFGKTHDFVRLRELLGAHLRNEQEANPGINSVGLIDQAGQLHWTLIPDGDLEVWTDELLDSLAGQGVAANRSYQLDLMKYRATPRAASAFMVVIMPLGTEPQTAAQRPTPIHRGVTAGRNVLQVPAMAPVVREANQVVRPAGMPVKRMALQRLSPAATEEQPAAQVETPAPPVPSAPPAPPVPSAPPAPQADQGIAQCDAGPPRAAPGKKMAGANRTNKLASEEQAYRIWRFHDWLWNTTYQTFNFGRFARGNKKIADIWLEADQRIKPAHKENYAVYIRMLVKEYEPTRRESLIGRDPIRKMMLKEIQKADEFARSITFPDAAAYAWALDRDRFAEFHAFLWGVKGHAGTLQTLATTDKKIQKTWDEVENRISPTLRLRFDSYVQALAKGLRKAGLWGVPATRQKILAEIDKACQHVHDLPLPDASTGNP